MPTVTSSMIGVSLTRVDDSSSQMFPLGSQVLATNGSLFEYCTCLSVISQYNAVVINDAGQASNAETTNLAAGAVGNTGKVGYAQVSIPLSSYAWIQRAGKGLVNVLANCQDYVPLFATTTPGKVDDVTVSEMLLLGLRTTTSITTASAMPAVGAASVKLFPFANPA